MLKDALSVAVRLVKDVFGIDLTPPPLLTKTPPPASGPADGWIADFWAAQAGETGAKIVYRMVLDDVETSAPTEPDIRRAIGLLAEAQRDFLVLERADIAGFDEEDSVDDADADDFLQVAADGSGAFDLEFGVDLGGKEPTLFASAAPLTAAVLADALLDYRGGGGRWITLCGWRRKI